MATVKYMRAFYIENNCKALLPCAVYVADTATKSTWRSHLGHLNIIYLGAYTLWHHGQFTTELTIGKAPQPVWYLLACSFLFSNIWKDLSEKPG